MGADARIRNGAALIAIGVSLALCAGCSGPRSASDASGFGRSRGYYKVGAPYQVNGVWYYPRVDYAYDETGTASWYGEAFNGRPTANGEIFDLTQVSAAHKTLQLPSVVEVTNLQNGRALKVRVNDRGPFAGDRIIDLSRRAAQLLGFERAGTAPVRVKIIKEESIKVAEAAMRGDVGHTRLGQATRPVRTAVAAAGPNPGGIRAAPPAPMPAVASASVAAPSPGPAPALSPPPGEPPRVASEHLAEPAEHNAARRSTWPALIASAQAAPIAPTPNQQRPVAAPSARIFIQAGMFAVAENAQRVKARFARTTGTEVSRVSVNGNSLYRVRLGPVASEAEARRLLGELAESGIPDARVVEN
ncbi:MAG: septal ring lytic transglycosylase RlpA family protein [Alphaproteobacteria bacterium]